MARKKHPGIKHVPQDKSPTEAELAWARANNPSGVKAIVLRIDAEAAKQARQALQAKTTRGGGEA